MNLPQHIYVVSGQPLWLNPILQRLKSKKYEKFKEPKYSTNVLDYNLNIFDSPVDQDEYNLKYKDIIKAFIEIEDAIDFAYSCNLDSVTTMAYKFNGKSWDYDKELTNSAFDIDW